MLALAAEGGGPDVVGYWGELGGVDKARELGALGAAGDLFADGALGSHTACLRTVYADDSHHRATATSPRPRSATTWSRAPRPDCRAASTSSATGRWTRCSPGSQEAAERVGVDALRAARHRLEHVEMIDADGIAVLARLGVFASVQPVFDALWGGEDGMYVQRLGAERARGMNPFAAFLSAGVPIALGTDSPVTPLGPWAAVRAAAYHQTPESRLSVRAAFAAHTRGRLAGRRAR